MTQEPTLSYFGSLTLKNGHLHLLHNSDLPAYYSSFHPKTHALVCGTSISMKTAYTVLYGERSIELEEFDLPEVISLLSEQSDAWITLKNSPEIEATIRNLLTDIHILNPDMDVIFRPDPAPQTSGAGWTPALGAAPVPAPATRPPAALPDLPLGRPDAVPVPVAVGSAAALNAQQPIPRRVMLPGEANQRVRQARLQEQQEQPRPAPERSLFGQLRRLFGG
ncbi:hypothetical protein [Deinococcus ficus]|uniref:Uncharacterized protein n=1 Tax=Deinococcus ficus TaxID=317577 RepID=A0A221T3H5_9DEIO|nr:hypothetical protein [Deinococcus ficus]ASN83452.1 hypothetical protein DFI_19840 [Deinococcus ficus]